MKHTTLILAAGLFATGLVAAHEHGAGHADHEKMDDAQKQAHHAEMLQEVLAGSWRSEANRARDVYRHPAETLTFFGVNPHSKVLEIWPGGGWYAEILAPYTTLHGR